MNIWNKKDIFSLSEESSFPISKIYDMIFMQREYKK